MKKSFPIIGTLVVAAAVITMIALGIWQLQRADWKNALLASYEAASDMPAVSFPNVPIKEDAPIYRKSSVNCIEVASWRATSGRNAKGVAGWAHIASCQTGGGEGPGAKVVVGWSKHLLTPTWTGGIIDGVIAPDSKSIIRLVASEPIEGLEKNQPPSLDDIPNNHFAYAMQWFFFAGIALIIFVLAARQRKAR